MPKKRSLPAEAIFSGMVEHNSQSVSAARSSVSLYIENTYDSELLFLLDDWRRGVCVCICVDSDDDGGDDDNDVKVKKE